MARRGPRARRHDRRRDDRHPRQPPEHAGLLDPDPASYPVPQRFAAALRARNGNGIVYPSLRYPGGVCFAAFWPNVVTPPMQGDHYRDHWNGRKVDLVQRLTGEKPVFSLP